jgi:hypothetical protein
MTRLDCAVVRLPNGFSTRKFYVGRFQVSTRANPYHHSNHHNAARGQQCLGVLVEELAFTSRCVAAAKRAIKEQEALRTGRPEMASLIQSLLVELSKLEHALIATKAEVRRVFAEHHGL